MSDGPTEVLGFDLGHGETAVARASLTADTPAEMLEIQSRKSIVTAVGRHPTRGVVVGEAALVDPSIEDAAIGFKGSPLGRPGESPVQIAERNERVKQFFRGCLLSLAAGKQLSDLAGARVYVGCPSSWVGGESEGLGSAAAGMAVDGATPAGAYEALLRSTGCDHVRVVAESRGAFLQAMESGKLTIGELESSVLVIDIGSSTTDFTLVHDLRDSPVDFGHPELGASLIDREILRRTIASHPRRDELAAIMERFPFVRARLELACRRAKEAYFSDEEAFADPATPLVRSENIQRQFHVDIVLDGPTMASILDAPQAALGGMGWRSCFRRALEEARDHLESQGVRLSALLLTGGASRMRFTRDLCERVFPGARFQPDSSPEFCIAMGLAYVGRYEVRTAGFMREIEALCGSDRIVSALEKSLPGLVDMIAQPLAEGLATRAFGPAIEEWKDGRLRTLRELEVGADGGDGRIAVLAKAYLGSEEARAMVGQVSIRWLDLVQAEVQRQIEQICLTYRIPAGALRFDLTPELGDFLRGPLPGVDPANLNFIGAVVTGIVALVVAGLLGGGGIALLHAGPLGWLAGAAIGAGAAYLGVSQAKDRVRTADLPLALRSAAFLVRGVEDRCRDMVPELRRTIRQQLDANPGAFRELFETIRGRMREELLGKARRVRVFIGIGASPTGR